MGSEQNPYIEDVDDIIALITEKSSMRCLVHPSLLALVDGFCDENCILSMLNGCSHILQKIWEIVRLYWRRCIVHGCKDHDHNSIAPSTGQRTIYIDQLGEWSFPTRYYHLEQYQYHYDINVTMMPFVISRYFEYTKLPAYLKLYWERFISSYLSHPYPAIGTPLIDNDDFGNIGFLTVREGFVEPGETLFECGGGVNIHCCSRLTLKLDSFDGKYICVGSDEISTENHEELLTNMGGGEIISNPVSTSKKYLGGMYMITNVPNTCRFWNCQINVEDTEVSGWTRNVEHFRGFLPRSCNRFTHKHVEETKENTMYWFTDRTPFEWIPLQHRTYQQVIQFVLTDVSVWFEDFSTPNPLGLSPDPNKTKIVKSNFETEI